ncbi:MAG: B12-binding domain-containing radical SAM protein [Candidatus Eisenbacteria bacterium]|uniref:B12-binding domain-containing radical SAM protein n=1 Tax=Eiseniibacteriota bacterium TaxID=2212470 RepID=A0A948RXC3_UNCEI|nr:B12-binding domain-containing radical SAM protein [Candidatus Eisenbacteria bacterium]MBU1947817.1 B12-binding domain-containing radical SAM protein [Candidatus Eisenbacteria bacterium]MBU2691273.1 B12-binding domain-containing radical SAM protein [Candidatus Eisenbacteria bacterium]
MRVAFVDDTVRFSIPLGITGIAAVLRGAGHEVSLTVIGSHPEEAISRLAAIQPDIVAFSIMSGSHQAVLRFATSLKEQFSVPTVWGGPHPTFFPEMIEHPCVDAVCLGEGEEAMALLADRFDREGRTIPTDVRGFWVKREKEIFKNPILPRNKKLDELPFPARDLYLDQFPILHKHGIKHFMAHRGCPYKCTYCFNDSYNQMYKDQVDDRSIFSSRSADSICDEILDVREQTPLKMVAFVDDVFTLNRRWTLEFCRIYTQRCRIPFSINARFDNVDGEMVEALAEAGLRLVYAGIESGDETIRNQVMKRKMDLESIYKAAELYKKNKIKLLTENILGVPGETFDTAMNTLKVNQKVRPNVANASIFTPYPKLKMTQYAIENGYFDGDFDRLNHNYYHDSILSFNSEIDKRRILNLRCFFSVLARHPGLYGFVRPLLDSKPNIIFRWFGDLADGFYLKRCIAYGFGPGEFMRTLVHFLKSYRQGSNGGKTINAKQPDLVSNESRRDQTHSPTGQN